MNIEKMRQKVAEQVKIVPFDGEEYRLRKLEPVDGLEFGDFLASLEMDGDGDAKKIKHPADLVRLHSLLLSKAIVDENDSKTLDSDEGRALLASLSGVVRLGNIAMDWCYPEQKKS